MALAVGTLAVVLDGPSLRAWQRDALQLAARELDVRVVAPASPSTEASADPGPLARAFDRWDGARMSPSFARVFAEAESGLSWRTVPNAAAVAAAVRGFDVVLDFTGQPERLSASLSERPRLGVWFFESGGAPLRDGVGIGFDVLDRNQRTATVSLLALDDRGRRTLCWRTEVRAHPTSPAITEERVLTAGVPSLIEGLRRAAAGRLGPVLEDTPKPRASGVHRLRVIAHSLVGTVANQLAREGREQWSVATLPAGGFPPAAPQLRRARWHDPDPSHFLADPFPFVRDGRSFVFVEELPYETDRGHISVMDVQADGSLSAPRKVLETPYHLSFPFVFQHEGRAHLLPEQAQRGDVVLYREVDFPDRWEEERVLLRGFPGIDPVLHHDGRRWWLFVSYGGHENYDNNLFLFFADRLEDEFRPHAGNPIKLDIGASRNAGALVAWEGALYRPAQNCADRYGGSIVFHRIEALTPTEFREVRVLEIGPVQGPFDRALHTYNRAGDLIVIDGLRELPARARPGRLASAASSSP
jgi:hypothetical protein